MTSLTVIKPGMLTTVQDLGRRGYQGLGVPVAGPMDWYSHRRANQLLGNDPMAAALEITLIGPELVADGDVVAVVTGAEFETLVDATPIPHEQSFTMRSGSRLRFGARKGGARSTLAIKGGLVVPLTLGSRATHLASAMGGVDGRALRPGDRLPVGEPLAREADRSRDLVGAATKWHRGAHCGGRSPRSIYGRGVDGAHLGAFRHHASLQPDGVSARRATPRAQSWRRPLV